MKTNAEFLGSFRRPLHPLVSHPWWNSHTYRLDLLHLIDHHGIAGNIIGNTFWAHISGERMCDVLPGSTVESRLEALNIEIKEFYDANRVDNRLPKLKLDNIKSDTFPELHGPAVKAANTRALVPYVLDLQRRAASMQPNRKHTHMTKVLESLQAAIEIFYTNSFFLSPETVTSLRGIWTGWGATSKCCSTLRSRKEELVGRRRSRCTMSLHT